MSFSRRTPSAPFEAPAPAASSARMRVAQRVAPSGRYPLHYTRLREILL